MDGRPRACSASAPSPRGAPDLGQEVAGRDSGALITPVSPAVWRRCRPAARGPADSPTDVGRRAVDVDQLRSRPRFHSAGRIRPVEADRDHQIGAIEQAVGRLVVKQADPAANSRAVRAAPRLPLIAARDGEPRLAAGRARRRRGGPSCQHAERTRAARLHQSDERRRLSRQKRRRRARRRERRQIAPGAAAFMCPWAGRRTPRPAARWRRGRRWPGSPNWRPPPRSRRVLGHGRNIATASMLWCVRFSRSGTGTAPPAHDRTPSVLAVASPGREIRAAGRTSPARRRPCGEAAQPPGVKVAFCSWRRPRS